MTTLSAILSTSKTGQNKLLLWWLWTLNEKKNEIN